MDGEVSFWHCLMETLCPDVHAVKRARRWAEVWVVLAEQDPREIVKEMDEVAKDISQEHMAEGSVEQSDDLPVPQVMVCVEVGKIIGHERIVAQIDDLSVPHIIEEILDVVNARPLERSTERIVAQIDSGKDSGGGRGWLHGPRF